LTNYVWTYKEWAGRFPSLGSDEYARHTLVLPNPFKVVSVDEEDGTAYRSALVMVISPWWACSHILDPEYRRETRKHRAQQREFEAETEADDAAAFEAELKAVRELP
jgi:hypothetical protein